MLVCSVKITTLPKLWPIIFIFSYHFYNVTPSVSMKEKYSPTCVIFLPEIRYFFKWHLIFQFNYRSILPQQLWNRIKSRVLPLLTPQQFWIRNWFGDEKWFLGKATLISRWQLNFNNPIVYFRIECNSVVIATTVCLRWYFLFAISSYSTLKHVIGLFHSHSIRIVFGFTNNTYLLKIIRDMWPRGTIMHSQP